MSFARWRHFVEVTEAIRGQ